MQSLELSSEIRDNKIASGLTAVGFYRGYQNMESLDGKAPKCAEDHFKRELLLIKGEAPDYNCGRSVNIDLLHPGLGCEK